LLDTRFPPNCFFLFGNRHPHVTHCSSGQAHSSSHAASRSVQPFCMGSKCYTVQCTVNEEEKTPKLSIPLGISSPCRRRTEPRRYAACTKYLVKIARVIPEISLRPDRQTHKHAHHSTSQPLPRAK